MKRNTIKVFTPSVQAFIKNIGLVKNVELCETTLNGSSDDIVLFSGSLLDRAEINYRELTNCIGVYMTVVTDDIDIDDVEKYWFENSNVVYKHELEKLLNQKETRCC